MSLFAFRRTLRHERTGFALYGAAVAISRDPFYFSDIGVPDTLDGRFDLVGLHVCLVIRRLRHGSDKKAVLIAQKVFDAMFSDMDITLREIGVGDMSIARRVRAMWEAFHGRCAAYDSALDREDEAALEAALVRNVWRGAPTDAAPALARIVRAQNACLMAQPLDDLVGGVVRFRPPAEVVQ
jgi:cytochrome b pre-mRNA-processing protein 3